ncbi:MULTISPECIES: YihY/virulence factor BrkB family protein [Rhizobium]|uniref:YihY/virulence factor BrkB family protein n=1 Tax=Rhizobium rhododendri TaxID=2506430 RepID=A0ABY8IS09_9HYPH|nr:MULTISPECIES: YihY/virulence factor BrkB family protein [Rhizobium]WFS26504.1 YihY/virulence factor BrkB family protein [Rhizobium rhododendri]
MGEQDGTAALTEGPALGEAGRGRDAETPSQIPMKGLKDVLWRVVSEVMEDRVTLIAAGVTYYLLLAMFPALGALVSIYGFVSDPTTIATHIGFLSQIFPRGSFDLILSQLTALTQQKPGTLSIGFVTGLLIALWSANNGVKALCDAMNVAYGEEEKRGIVEFNLLSLAFTFGLLIFAVVLIFAIGVIPAILSFIWLGEWTDLLTRLARWPIILGLVMSGIMLLYNYGPSRQPAKVVWLSWGAVFSTLLWLLSSFVFSYYLDHFADYNATYGTLGALIGFMVWIWISVIIIIVGAEINAELEHQTREDSTTGPPRPMGERGAYVADTLGKTAD